MRQELEQLSQTVGQVLKVHQLMVATAESCTGGWVAKVLTDIAGSSAWVERGFVTYTNQAKVEMLGVRQTTLEAHGAVSEQTVREMAVGALANSLADVAVAISGVAGPGGGAPDKPVGTVWFAWARRGDGIKTACDRFDGDREAVRQQAVLQALRGIKTLVEAE